MSTLQMSKLDIAVGDRLLIGNLDCRIDRGEFWCVLGKNGVGKTTLLQVIAGLRSPLKGQIQLCGDALQSTPLALLAQLMCWLQLLVALSPAVLFQSIVQTLPQQLLIMQAILWAILDHLAVISTACLQQQPQPCMLTLQNVLPQMKFWNLAQW